MSLVQALSQVNRALSAVHPNYVQLQKASVSLKEKIKTVVADSLSGRLAHGLLESASQVLKQHEDEIPLHVKWDRLGFNTDFIATHPDFVNFLLDSGLAFQICGLRHSLTSNPEKHVIAKDVDGHPQILVEGKLVRWEVIKATFGYLKQYHVQHKLENPDERWTYTSHVGLAPLDIYRFDKPFHVYELPHDVVSRLQNYAAQGKPDPNKNYVLQVCTSKGVLFGTSGTFMGRVAEKLATHYGLRIITPTGEVYSFGYRRDIGEQQYVGASSLLGQVKGRVAMHDFEELRAHSGRFVTTLPASKEAADQILAEIMAVNESNPSFDYFHDNCVELTTRCMGFAGINVQTKETLEGFMRGIATTFFKKMPILGVGVRKVAQAVQAVYAKLPGIPVCVKSLTSRVVKVVTYIPNKIGAVAKNLLVWAIGWTKASPTLAALKPTRTLAWLDFFNHKISDINYSRNLLRWQKQQKTTYCHAYVGYPTLAILPPDS